MYRVIRDDTERRRLCQLLEYTPYSRMEFNYARALLRKSQDRIERAWAVLVIGNTARAGIDPTAATRTWWGYNIKSSQGPRWQRLPEIISEVAKRFKRVQLENSSWEKVLIRFDSPGTFFSVDPPYPFGVRSNNRAMYTFEMADLDHERLLLRLRTIQGKAMVFCYNSRLYHDLLKGWRLVKVTRRCAIPCRGAKPVRVEHVWMNY